MTKKILFFILVCCIIIAGCESTKPIPGIKSLPDHSYSGVIKKIFIVIQLPENGWSGLEPNQDSEENNTANRELFRDTILNYFNKLNIQTQTLLLTGNNPKERELNKWLDEFSGDAVFTIHTISYSLEGNKLNELLFDVSIFDELTDKRIWKANWVMSTTDPDTGEQNADGKSIAEKLIYTVVTQLKADGMKIF